MHNRFLLLLSSAVVFSACTEHGDIWPGSPPQIREIAIVDGSYRARTSFTYDIYNALTGVLFTGPTNVYDCEAGFTIADRIMQIPDGLDSQGMIEVVWEAGKIVQYFEGDKIVHLRYQDGRPTSAETLINGTMVTHCLITHDGDNIKAIEKYDAEENLVSKTEFLSYDDKLNPLATQWWYWWIAWDKGYHWENAFPILLFMKNNPLQIKTTVDGIALVDEIQYIENEQSLITEMSVEGDHGPYAYTIFY